MPRVTPLPSWIVAIAFAGSVQLALGQTLESYVPKAVIGARVGSPANFTCQSNGIPIAVCLWEREAPAGSNAQGFPLSINAANSRPGESIQPGYTYVGDGLEKGHCGLKIAAVKDDDIGNWKCTLITNSGAYRGAVHLEVMRKPEPPRFNPSVLPILVDYGDSRRDKLHPPRIYCFSGNGQPGPRFKWFIDNDPLQVGLTHINTTVDHNSGITYTFQELANYRFTWRDNGKKLRCVAFHETFGQNDVREASLDIVVNYPPRPAHEDLGRSLNTIAHLGTEKLLSVKVAANPTPTEVTWTVDNKHIRSRTSTDKYEAMPIRQIEPGVWEANLRIKYVQEEDVDKRYFLRVVNSVGDAEFDLNVASDGSGMSIGKILTILTHTISIFYFLDMVIFSK